MIRRRLAARRARHARWEAECATTDAELHRRLDREDGRA